MRTLLLLLLPCLLLTQCGIPYRVRTVVAKAAKKNPAKKDTKKGERPGSLRGLMDSGEQGTAYGGGAALAPGSSGSAEGGVFDFSGVVQTQVQNFGRVGWHNSLTTAAQESRREGKPLLILFTHQNSSSAQALENTLVLTPDFRKLVEESFVPLRINYGDTDTRQSPFYRDFKTRLEAKGYPTLIVTLPDGTEIDRIAGYNEKSAGENSAYRNEYLQRLRKAVSSCEKAAASRRKDLESKGYRFWSTKSGSPVFARLDSLDANKATFIGEWGDSFNTFLNRLSDEDRQQIELRRGTPPVSPPDPS